MIERVFAGMRSRAVRVIVTAIGVQQPPSLGFDVLVGEVRDFHGSDCILLIGGDLHAQGSDLVANCRRFDELAGYSPRSEGVIRSRK